MPLERKIVPIQFGGLDQGATDPKLVTDGLLRCENALFSRRGAISKRKGLKLVATATSSPFLGTLNGRVAAYGENILVHKGSAATDADFDTVKIGGDGSASRIVGLCDLSSDRVAGISPLYDYQQVNVCLISSLYLLYTYTRRENTVDPTLGYYRPGATVVNRHSGVVVDTWSGSVESTAERQPFISCGAGSGEGWIIYTNSSGLFRTRRVSGSGVIGSENAITGMTSGTYTAHQGVTYRTGASGVLASFTMVDSTHGHVIFLNAAGTSWAIGAIDLSGSSASTKTHATTITVGTDADCVGAFKWASGKSCLLYAEYRSGTTDTRLYADVVDNTATSIMGSPPHLLDSWSSTTPSVSSIAGYSHTANAATIYYTRDGTASSDTDLKWVTLTDSLGSAVVGTPTLMQRATRCRLVSHPWVDTHGSHHVCIMSSGYRAEEDQQPALYIHRIDRGDDVDDGAIVGWCRAADCQRPYGAQISTPVDLGTGYVWLISALGRTINPLTDTALITTPGALQHGQPIQLTVDTQRRPAQVLDDGDAMYIANGLPYEYDGQYLSEMGPLHYPDGVTATAAGGGSGIQMPAGTYGYVAVYEWTDARGRLIRSAPSRVATATVVSTNDRVDVRVPFISFSRRYSDARIALYRSDVNGSTYRRVGAVPGIGLSTAISVVLQDTGYDNESQEVLYTLSGELANFGPASHRVACLHNQRYWYVPRDNEADTIRYSKRREASRPYEFSDVLEHRVSPEGGRIVALQPIDDKLIVFKQDQIYAVAGDGADSTGVGSTLSDSFQISSGVGCTNRDSVVTVPGGIMFLSRDGIQMLTRQMTVSPVGRRVKYHTDASEIRSATVDSKRHIAVFATSAGVLVYDYLHDEWSVWLTAAFSGARFGRGELYLSATATDKVYVTDDSRTDDEDYGNISLKIDTGWIPLNGLHGFGRIYSGVIGAYYDGTDATDLLTIRTAYDYDHYWVDSQTYAPHTKLGQRFLWSSYFGSDSSSNKDKALMIEIVGSRQKATSVRYEISETSDDAIDLLFVALLIGIKQSTVRLGSGRR